MDFEEELRAGEDELILQASREGTRTIQYYFQKERKPTHDDFYGRGF